jgi:CRISPR system Cascade subunit CasB
MPLDEAAPSKTLPEQPDNAANASPNPITGLTRIMGQAARFTGDAHGLGSGEHAALARLDPDSALRPHQMAALTRALLYAGLEPDHWHRSTWRRWALIAHGIALAGHDGSRSLGQQLCDAGVAESRVTKLLTARGEAFRQLLPRLLRLLASKEVAPNWYELGGLILHEGCDDQKAETIRLKIASRYFTAVARSKAQDLA